MTKQLCSNYRHIMIVIILYNDTNIGIIYI